MVAKICTAEGCERKVAGRGLCGMHYQRFRKSPEWTPPISREESFWQKVNKCGPIPIGTPAAGECWLWTAHQDGHGYGSFWNGTTKVKAYAFAYCLENDAPPKGWHIDHICHTTLCVRPSHLRAITHQQNIQNRGAVPRNNKSGYRGVHWAKHANKWRAKVDVLGKAHNLGYFDTAEEANAAVIAARNRLHTHNDLDRIKKDAA